MRHQITWGECGFLKHESMENRSCLIWFLCFDPDILWRISGHYVCWMARICMRKRKQQQIFLLNCYCIEEFWKKYLQWAPEYAKMQSNEVVVSLGWESNRPIMIFNFMLGKKHKHNEGKHNKALRKILYKVSNYFPIRDTSGLPFHW